MKLYYIIILLLFPLVSLAQVDSTSSRLTISGIGYTEVKPDQYSATLVVNQFYSAQDSTSSTKFNEFIQDFYSKVEKEYILPSSYYSQVNVSFFKDGQPTTNYAYYNGYNSNNYNAYGQYNYNNTQNQIIPTDKKLSKTYFLEFDDYEKIEKLKNLLGKLSNDVLYFDFTLTTVRITSVSKLYETELKLYEAALQNAKDKIAIVNKVLEDETQTTKYVIHSVANESTLNRGNTYYNGYSYYDVTLNTPVGASNTSYQDVYIKENNRISFRRELLVSFKIIEE